MFKMLLMLSWDIFISQLTVKELCCFMMLVKFVYHNGGKICHIDNLFKDSVDIVCEKLYI